MEIENPTLVKQVRAMQIIWFALLVGVATFAVVTVVIHSKKPDDDRFLSTFLVIIAATNAMLSFIVPGIMGNVAIKQVAAELKNADEEVAYPRLAILYQTSLIVALAMLEAGAFCAITGYLLEGVWWTLLVAGILAFIMLLHFPSVGRVEAWCRTQYETIRLGAM
jgi:hypothetical protein